MKENKDRDSKGFAQQLSESLAQGNKEKWDTILTDAIEITNGSIKPYDNILKYVSNHYEIKRKQ